MAKIGFPGILEINREAGTLVFRADPHFFPGNNNAILTISGLSPADLDLVNNQLNIALPKVECVRQPAPLVTSPTSKSTPAQSPTSKSILAKPRPIANPIVPALGSCLIPGSYADILYPAVIIQIMQQVLAGRWAGPNPEECIDTVIATWVAENIADPQRYISDLIAAVKQRDCLDIVLARLNAELVSKPDQGDAITISRGRRMRLPGECGGVGHLINNLPEASFCDGLEDEPADRYSKAFLVAEKQAQTFYAANTVYQLRPPRPNLSLEAKSAVKEHLVALGYRLSDNVDEALTILEKMLKERDLEQTILGRLLYLAVFQALRQLDGRLVLQALPVAPLALSMRPPGQSS